MHGGARIGSGRKSHAALPITGSDPFVLAKNGAEKRKVARTSMDSNASGKADGACELSGDNSDARKHTVVTHDYYETADKPR